MTTRTTRLLALILVSLAACGDDGNPGTNAVCGDGTREGPEQCDDGNTTAGDGCSAVCTSELSMVCGNGAIEGTETCDDGNTMNGDGCSSTCTTESATCGDGNITGNETCDDSNTASGDGCSSSCQIESPAGCGNGTIASPEMCDDGDTMSGDGCNANCQPESGYTCTGMPSVCTMVTPAGTCGAPFVVNLTATGNVLSATMTGDTTASTNQVPMANCSGGLPMTGVGKDHVYRLTTTDVRDISIEVSDTSAFDTVLRVLSVPCDPTMAIPERAGFDGCDDADPSGELLEFTALPAGTYYIVIDGYTATDAGAYSFTVTARPTLCGNGTLDPVSAIAGAGNEACDDADMMAGDGCNARCDVEPGFTCTTTPPAATVCVSTCGNGVVDTGETCDDGGTASGNGCSATCQTETGYVCTGAPSTCMLSCGNGTLDLGEECEDGGTANGDRCSSTCTLESDTAEVEPNNTTAQVLSAGNHIIRGTMDSNDIDLYTFTLAAPATVHIETYFSLDPVSAYEGVGTLTNVDCDSDELDTVVRLFSGTANTTNGMELFTDDDDGDETCSYLGPQDSADDSANDTANPLEGVLAAGTYTIKVNDFDGLPVSRYILDIKIVGGGTPVAPVAGDLVINEILAADNVSDSNCDGSGLTTDVNDEFVELVNVSANTLNLAGVTISEANSPLVPRHVFAAGTTVAPGKAIVVWGGGTPNCPGVTNFAVASAGMLSLNDTGDTVTVATAGAVMIAQKVFSDAEATINVSLNRSPDVTGPNYALHNAIVGAAGAFTPGKRFDNTAF